MEKQKIAPISGRLVTLLLIFIGLSATAQTKETYYVLFDSLDTSQKIQRFYERKEMNFIYFTFMSDKHNTEFDFVFHSYRLENWVKQKGDTTFYAGRDLFEGKRCYDGAWFKQAFREEADFMARRDVTIYLVDIRDERDGKYRVYRVKYEGLVIM